MIETLKTLLLKNNIANLAYLGPHNALCDALESLSIENDFHFVELNTLSKSRWGHGGEYFETIVINEAFEDDPKVIERLKFALLKNNHLIYLSPTEDKESLKEILEPYGFSDICTIVEDNVNINLIKKWFTFEQ